MLLKGLASVIVGAVIGVAAAIAPLFMGQLNTNARNGAWSYSTGVGSEAADPYTRAWVALFGIWALRSDETMYASAEADSAGAPLDPNCSYRVAGGPIDTRWWSLTVYQNNHFVPNPDNRYSWSSTTVGPDADGRWEVVVSPQAQAGRWLPIDPARGAVALSLRFYNPNPGLAAKLAAEPLPLIEKLGCP